MRRRPLLSAALAAFTTGALLATAFDPAGAAPQAAQPLGRAGTRLGTVSVCVAYGTHPTGWIISAASRLSDTPGGCTDQVIEDTLSCLDQVPAGAPTDVTADQVRQCLGRNSVDTSVVNTSTRPAPIDGLRDAFAGRGDHPMVSTTGATSACRPGGADPTRAEESHPGGGGTVETAFKAFQLGPFILGLSRFEPSRKDYLVELGDENFSDRGDAAAKAAQQQANRLNLERVSEAAQVEVPTPLDTTGGLVELAKATYEVAKEKVVAAADAVVSGVKNVFSGGTTPSTATTPSTPATSSPSPAASNHAANGLQSGCQAVAERIAACNATGWLDGDCKDLKSQLDRCDGSAAYTADGSACPTRSVTTPTNAPSVSCSSVAHPMPGVAPCKAPTLEAPTSIEKPTADPCNGANPYALTDPAGCVRQPLGTTGPSGPAPNGPIDGPRPGSGPGRP